MYYLKKDHFPEEYLEIGYNNDGPIVYINRGHSNVQFVKKMLCLIIILLFIFKKKN